MSDMRELAAGVVCTGFDGTSIDAAFERELRDLRPAGLILFARNVESLAQTRALTDRIREILPDPIVAIDQEGGRVARLRDGVEEIPAMLAVAATGDPALAERAGAQMAFDLRRAGVNLDFAPVLDLALHAANTVIGSRSFGEDPATVVRFAGAIARGLRSQGIVPTFKHFPGHGSTAVDSHLALPAIDDDEKVLRERDLAPFFALLPDAEAVMTAHIVVRAFDPQHPATISKRVLTDLLRREIGFAGVCFTDCMQMDAIAKGVGTAQGALEAIAAGADCVLISHRVDLAREAAERIAKAAEDGTLDPARLREAHDRVRALRSRLQAPLPLEAPPPHPGIGREIGRRAVTVLRGNAHAEAGGCVVVSFEGATAEGVQGLHVDHARVAGEQVAQLTLPLEPPDAAVDKALAHLDEMRKTPIVLMRRAHVYAPQLRAVRRIIEAFPDAILVSAREPFDAEQVPHARNVVCIYGDDAPSIAGLEDAIFGNVPA